MNAIELHHGLVPASMPEAMQLANMMATAKLVPQPLQKSPADCLMVIQQAVRWQMDPFAVAQECSVIQGKLMHSGKLVAAVVNARGNLANRLSFAYAGNGDERTITVSGRLQGESEPREVSIRLADAKTNNRVWQTQPDQQLMYHGTRVWARRHVPELMLGVYSPEEFDEPLNDPPPRPSGSLTLPTFENAPPPHTAPTAAQEGPAPVPPPSTTAGAGLIPSYDDYLAKWEVMLEEAEPSHAVSLQRQWNAEADLRRNIHWPEGDEKAALRAFVFGRIEALKRAPE